MNIDIQDLRRSAQFPDEKSPSGTSHETRLAEEHFMFAAVPPNVRGLFPSAHSHQSRESIASVLHNLLTKTLQQHYHSLMTLVRSGTNLRSC
jgi:hypothetical protein